MTHRLFFDANTIIDIALPNRPEHFKAIQLLEGVEYHEVEAFTCATSLEDAYYILRRQSDESFARGVIRSCKRMFELVPVDKAICKLALESDEPDFEDGVIRACAERIKADFIISRDSDSFKASTIKQLSPKEYVETFGGWKEAGFSLDPD